MTTVNIGIDNREVVATALIRFLANTYALQLKTQNFHWNVTGKDFHDLHVLFEEQYTDMQAAIDELAERVKALGYYCPGSFADFAKLAEIPEASAQLSAQDMVSQLHSDHQTLSRMGREVVKLADKEDDLVTSGMVAARMETHEKTAWMLRSVIS